MSDTFDAVVVGGGIVGAGLARELAGRGLGVLVCEQGRSPGAGATSRSGGLVRQHHTAHCDTRLAVASLPVFAEWNERIGGDCGYRRTGFVVVVGEHHRERLKHNVAAVNDAGGSSQVVEVEQIAEMHPRLAFHDGGLVAAYEPDGGYVDPAQATLSLLAAAAARGARYGEGTVVTGISVARGRVTGVETNLGRFAAPVVVLAAGAWSASLASSVGVRLPVEARRIGLARADVGAAEGEIPIGIDDTLGTYFRPAATRAAAYGVYFGVPTDPEGVTDGTADPITHDEAEAARRTVSTRIPSVGSTPVCGVRAGFDAYTPDRHPAIGPAGPDGLFLCTGFSGGGVKTVPVVAEDLAAEIVDGVSSPLLAPYTPWRFTTETLIESEHPYEHM